jgi:hypothetical protein
VQEHSSAEHPVVLAALVATAREYQLRMSEAAGPEAFVEGFEQLLAELIGAVDGVLQERAGELDDLTLLAFPAALRGIP